MKKLLLASAVAALSVSAAQAAPTVYGKAFLTLDVTSTESKVNGNKGDRETSRPSLNSNASRIGLKGSEALTANTDLVYKLEYGIDVDNGSVPVDQSGKAGSGKSQQFYSRDTYLGLSNAQYGTVMAGRLTGVDDAVNFADVSAGAGISDTIVSGGKRYDNAFAYATPDYNGMQFLAMYALDEDKTGREGFGVAAKYEQDAMNVGASYIQRAGKGGFKSALRVSGSYAVTPEATIGALYQLSDFSTDDKENAFTISGEMATATPWTAYAQGEMVSNAGGVKDFDAQRVAVGGKYAFNKATTGHVYGGYDRAEAKNANSKFEANGIGVGGGIEYKF